MKHTLLTLLLLSPLAFAEDIGVCKIERTQANITSLEEALSQCPVGNALELTLKNFRTDWLRQEVITNVISEHCDLSKTVLPYNNMSLICIKASARKKTIL
jgi:hypothetical protein